MADEFIANLNVGDPLTLHKIKELLYLSGNYALERDSQKEIALRFSRKERRPDWPDDFILSYDGSVLLLTIHSANREERNDVIRDVELALKQAGLTASFEEV